MTNIFDNIKDGVYENNVACPRRPPRQHRTGKTELAYYEALKSYRMGAFQAREKFKADLFEYCGMTGHPKAERAFSLAWYNAHSGGYNSVVYYFEELADLILPGT